MADFYKSTQSASPKAQALLGRGISDPAHEGRYAVTAINCTSPNHVRTNMDIEFDAQHSEERCQRNVFASGEAFPIDAFAFDMLRRGASISDGNAFYRQYDPKLMDSPKNNEGWVDLSIQYSDEAGGAAKALDGLNFVSEDLVAASFLGKSSDRLDAGPHKTDRAEALAALVRLNLRLLCDTDDEKQAKENIADFFTGLTTAIKSVDL